MTSSPDTTTDTGRFLAVLDEDDDLAETLRNSVVAFRAEWGEEPDGDAVADAIEDACADGLPDSHRGLSRIIATAVDGAAVVAWLDANRPEED